MLLEIEMNQAPPIYQQLVLQIKKGILKGELALGETLPSVRVLAGDIGINMHTVNKAYKILAEEGVLEQMPKGFRVCSQLPVKADIQHQKQLKALIEEIVVDGLLYDYHKEDLQNWVATYYQELSTQDKGDSENG